MNQQESPWAGLGEEQVSAQGTYPGPHAMVMGRVEHLVLQGHFDVRRTSVLKFSLSSARAGSEDCGTLLPSYISHISPCEIRAQWGPWAVTPEEGPGILRAQQFADTAQTMITPAKGA